MSEPTGTASPTTVVPVHGAFADASSWKGVIKRLQAQGVPVTAPANPLRAVSTDSAYISPACFSRYHVRSLPSATPPLLRWRGHHQCRDEGEQRCRPGLRRRFRW